VGRDLRPSSERIARAVAGAADGRAVIDCGAVPTPALALAAISAGAPSVMVTGSHIPADRNGLKFYSPTGEITKAQEAAITRCAADQNGALAPASVAVDPDAGAAYAQRYLDFFPPGALDQQRIGVYEHSSVARDLLAMVLRALGASVVSLARSETFIPVDTEAVDTQTRADLRRWSAEFDLDAVVSTDGDADRPLVADAAGRVIPGDVLGCLTARALGADHVVTPVSSNSMVELSRAFDRVHRTRIGSPFVIAGMEQERDPKARTVGFEANGGFLLGFDATVGSRRIARLMTRDAFLPILASLADARARGLTLADLVATLPRRVTASDRLENVPTDQAQALVANLSSDPVARSSFFADFGAEACCDLTDGVRVSFTTGLILHLRPSGNAPELRCYAEASEADEAENAMRVVLARARARIG
jgi:phosphomannomutase